MTNDKTISTLNNLIATVKDGQNGFQTAAEGVTDPQVKATFLEYSSQRAQMARELQDEVRGLGGDPEKSGSVAASMHRGWINIKSTVTGKDEHAIIAEAERGEDVAKSTYESALKEMLPASAQTLVQQQMTKVRQAHDDVRGLRDREKPMR